MAVVGNGLYLLWPVAPETLVITPHPATLRSYEDSFPVLVEAPTLKDTSYRLVQETTLGDRSRVAKTKPYSTRTFQKSEGKKAFAGKVNLNTATMEQLQLLPGVGPKMAERILSYRKQHGPFRSVEQLQDISGIGPKKFQKLAPHCAL